MRGRSREPRDFSQRPSVHCVLRACEMTGQEASLAKLRSGLRLFVLRKVNLLLNFKSEGKESSSNFQISEAFEISSDAGCARWALGWRCRPSPEETQLLLTRARTTSDQAEKRSLLFFGILCSLYNTKVLF